MGTYYENRSQDIIYSVVQNDVPDHNENEQRHREAEQTEFRSIEAQSLEIVLVGE